MDARLVALMRFLNELGIPIEIETIDDRKRVQKAVYLGQLSGVDLGYRFGWYLMGPYSPALTKDYYSLAEAIAIGDKAGEEMQFRSSLRDQLRRIRPLLELPEDVSLSQEEWLELVASLHYLRSISKYDPETAREKIKKDKRRLSPFFKQAQEALQKANLLS